MKLQRTVESRPTLHSPVRGWLSAVALGGLATAFALVVVLDARKASRVDDQRDLVRAIANIAGPSAKSMIEHLPSFTSFGSER